jgi:tetratricopeptide (TPR) repeat protein
VRKIAIALLILSGCVVGPQDRFDGLGPHTRKITTSSPEAQEYFNQGLAFLYAFNHDEAIRSFARATELDPACAMAHWGISVANGPHINNPAVDEAHAKAAWAALTKARENAASATPVEKALIDALGKRYADPQPQDRSGLDKAYADAMRQVWKAHPQDADVGALFAEAMMDLRPWDLWTNDKKPQPGTPEILHVLESVIAMSPNHPLALHLYIHAVEASPEPGKADVAADRLRDLCPGLGHLVHMPSHIDVKRGRWEQAITANRKAIIADDTYIKHSAPPGFYRVYMAHNRHMLAFAAMNRGESKLATEMIREMLAGIPADFIKAFAPVIDGFFATPYEMHLRFGRWDAMLAEPDPDAMFPIARALRLFARGVAYAALGRVEEAKAEQAAFLKHRATVPKEAFFSNNTAADLLAVAEKSLAGEILYRSGKTEEGFQTLREAVKLEDRLRYAEPPDWIQPVRHTLGAALMKSGLADEAEAIYREDLQIWPENGWSLLGLAQSLRAQGKDAKEIDTRFRKVWANADIKVTSSCLCLPASK